MTEEIKPWRIANDYLDSLLLLNRDDETPAADFHGAFIPAVAESFFLRLTGPDSWTWDPFAGSGTISRAAAKLDRRNAFMTDLNPPGPEIHKGDARYIRVTTSDDHPTISANQKNPPFLFDLIILHPPYHNIICFSDDLSDLSNFTTVNGFLAAFKSVAENAYIHLRPGGFLGLVMGDIWATGAAWVPLAFRCLDTALGACPSLSLRAIQVKDIKGNRQNKRRNLRRARCYNAGSVEFNHEYLMTFKKVRR